MWASTPLVMTKAESATRTSSTGGAGREAVMVDCNSRGAGGGQEEC